MKRLILSFYFLSTLAFGAGGSGGGSGNATAIQGIAISTTPPSGIQCLVSNVGDTQWAPGSCSSGSGVAGTWSSSTGNVVTTNGASTAQDSGTAFTSVVTLTGTQTVTNKTLTSPAINGATIGGTTAMGQGNSKILLTDGSGNLSAATQVTAAQLPNPTASTLGGIESYAAVTNQCINAISTSGVPSSVQLGFSNLSGSIVAAQQNAHTGDVTSPAGSAVTTVAAIAGTTVSGTTGTVNVAFSASPTFTGTASMVNITLSGTEKSGNCHIEPKEVDLGNSGSALAIDLSTGTTFTATLTAASPVITWSNPQAGCAYAIVFTQDGTGSRVPSYAGVTTIWGGSGTHTLSTVANTPDKFTCVYNGNISKLMCDLGLAYQ